MPYKMEVASQHCDTVPNKTKDILYTVKIERIFLHDSGARHTVQSIAVTAIPVTRVSEGFVGVGKSDTLGKW